MLHKEYLTQTQRLIMWIVLLVLAVGSCVVLFNFYKNDTVTRTDYKESGTVDYKVNLNENEYYDGDFDAQDRTYVANLIDTINVHFDYSFTTTQNQNVNLNYDTKGYLVIKDGSSDSVFLEKEYDLKKAANKKQENTSKSTISEDVLIDYSYYNTLASEFKTEYGVDTKSYLRVELLVEKQATGMELEDAEVYVDIPLSERSISMTDHEIEVDTTNQGDEQQKERSSRYILGFIIIGIIIVFIVVKLAIVVFQIATHKSQYQREVKQLLREYDRLIVETDKQPTVQGKNLILLKEFKELLDVRDNFKVPIMYCELVKDQKSAFYIAKDDDLYLYVLEDTEGKEQTA